MEIRGWVLMCLFVDEAELEAVFTKINRVSEKRECLKNIQVWVSVGIDSC